MEVPIMSLRRSLVYHKIITGFAFGERDLSMLAAEETEPPCCMAHPNDAQVVHATVLLNVNCPFWARGLPIN